MPMILMNLIVLWGLYGLEYHNEELIVHYPTELSRMTDSVVFLTIICLALYFVMNWMMNEYNRKIGKLKQTREQLSFLSMTDTLSGLYNRRHVMTVLKKEVRQVRELSLIMIDIDHFKRINDTYGHSVGDEVIVGIAQCLRSNLRGTDVIGRIGGEEFLVVFRNNDVDIAMRVAEKLRYLAEQIEWSKIEGPVTISAGVYMNRAGDSVNDLLEKVDVALYQAKNRGRNRVEVYSPEEELEDIVG